MKIFPIIKKVVSGGGAVAWQPVETIGVAIGTLLKWLGSQGAGVSIAQSPTTVVMPQAAGVAIAKLVSGGPLPTESAGVSIATVADLGRFPEAAGAKIVQITYALAGDYGANTSAVSHPSGSTDWTNPANAQGVNNGTNATIAGQVASAVDAVLTLGYATLPNKTALTITKVQVKYYASLTKSLTGTPSLAMSHSINGGTSYTTDQIQTGTFAGPFTFDITSEIAGDWANLQSLKAKAEFIATLGDISSSATLDAVEFLVTANTTQVP